MQHYWVKNTEIFDALIVSLGVRLSVHTPITLNFLMFIQNHLSNNRTCFLNAIKVEF